MMQSAKVRTICSEFGIAIVPANVQPMPGQTRALGTLERIMARHGEGHLRLVVATMAETTGNQGFINEYSAWAVSDLIRANADWIEDHAEEWFQAWDKIPLGFLMWQCQQLYGFVTQRQALAGMLYLLLSGMNPTRKPEETMGYAWMNRLRTSQEERLNAALEAA
ncbi:hypothetical protein [Sinorhizobium medicae]|uniref:hypothetical protein n=1 Tax=Sinorhizobium medicae TaxID=110321 RepID=UPI000C7E2D11|nr:hypothetical protein [Sinorhizobium medicae]MDX0512751.1 hypothetical protein [Sinorhizobium medicae]MDX0937369.1 hypothetical protein [Sinorhizobium medicae]MDX0943524.1 hypothetical protein [Sinorhizobium medicae]MDX0949022.1 hypothetical protein [Sinorhizobium medicae]MDX1010711.1 hypothetical protein [Sinorhizobium medicae]